MTIKASLDGVESKAIYNIANERFVFGSTRSILGVDLPSMPEWAAFKQAWNELELDRFMNDGGTYRRRRFGRFKYFTQDDRLEPQPHAPYSQPLYFNPLNGGMERNFAPLTPEAAANPVFRRLLHALGAAYAEIEDVPMWKVRTYFNRITASGRELGKPVPEGLHRDGVKFSCLLLANREGVDGGVTTVCDMDKQPIFTATLANDGDMLIFRDDTVYHDTTPVSPLGKDVEGHRDVLVVEFL